MFQITNKNEAKPITKHISCDCKCKFNSTTCNSKQKSNNQTCQCEHKNYRQCKQEYSWNPSTCICDREWWNCNCYGYFINKTREIL